MNKKLKKTLALGTGSMLVVASVGGGIAIADSEKELQSDTSVKEVESVSKVSAKTDIVTLNVVEGEFAYTQSAISTNEEIKNNIGASQYLCGARPVGDASEISVSDWQISVGGAVSNSYTATFDELVKTKPIQQLLLGCACAGNPSDGKASANAEITGISVLTLIDMAQMEDGVNTVVFTSADGYEVALPLSYIATRYCPLVFDVNGAPIAESMGGVNQLWLGSTSANYFARDVVAITLEKRETPPANPNSDEAREAYENLPNVGVMLGGEVA